MRAISVLKLGSNLCMCIWRKRECLVQFLDFKKPVIASYTVSIKCSYLIIFFAVIYPIYFPKLGCETRLLMAFAVVVFCSHLQVSSHQWSLNIDRICCYFSFFFNLALMPCHLLKNTHARVLYYVFLPIPITTFS